MRAKTITVTYLICPGCGVHRFGIDHLDPGKTFGPWTCQELICRTSIRGTVTADGAEIESWKEDRKPQFALLKFRDLYLVRIDKYGIENPDYFYHSHQCPTNLLGGIENVFDAETGSDPHGILRFVASVPWSEEAEMEMESICTLPELFAFFRTDGQPAPSEWPEENGGVLPFIVEMQRAETKKRSPKA